MSRLARALGALMLLALGCKEPVDDKVGAPPPPPPAPTKPVTRGQPPPEAKAFVSRAAPALKNPVSATFEGQLALIGYDVPKTSFKPGEAVPITLYWKALADVTENWQVFVHLDPLGVDDSSVRGFGDHYPVFGLYPTHGWKAGDIIRDQITVTLSPNARTAKVELWLGLYQGDRRAKLVGTPNDGKNRFKAAVFDVAGGAAAPAPKLYRVFRAQEKITLDGKLDEPSWSKVASTGAFVSTVGGRPVNAKTYAKMLWDDEYLYVAFYCEDTDIRSPYTKRDEPLWLADAVEIYLDPSGKGENYVELQVSPANVIFDAFFPKRLPPPNRGGDLAYTVNLKSGVTIDGTLNKPGDTDKSWTVEIAISFKDIKFAPNTPPKEGDSWRAHLIRVERTAGPIDDSAWSPPGMDYHNLDTMGTLVFSGAPGQIVPMNAAEPGKVKLPNLKVLKPMLRPKLHLPPGAALPPATLPAP